MRCESSTRPRSSTIEMRWLASSLLTQATRTPEGPLAPIGLDVWWLDVMPSTLPYQSSIASRCAVVNPKWCSLGRTISQLAEASDIALSDSPNEKAPCHSGRREDKSCSRAMQPSCLIDALT